ncbi:hypothetical protein GCM10010302_49910 [Streptomyces polychromogenes]|uniref:DUF397 domain-containing protein n=1 Tax=Streptomyces polychromogenes TaxID=67342 RepID=A0ABN0VJ32_9ACTN
MKVIAAASRDQWTRSRRSYERHACVRMAADTSGPITGSFFSQSMGATVNELPEIVGIAAFGHYGRRL